MNIVKKKTWKYWRSYKLYSGRAVPRPGTSGRPAQGTAPAVDLGSEKIGKEALGQDQPAPRGGEMGGGKGLWPGQPQHPHPHPLSLSEAKGLFVCF